MISIKYYLDLYYKYGHFVEYNLNISTCYQLVTSRAFA
uniref:Uncharacterized protein n=1 Tax=Rhizophora mucronata TaxID=61149 RepID=A0A2P2PFW0_RHIMU